MAEAVDRIIKEQGRIDVLINNAGYGSYGNIENVPIEEIKRQFDVNVFGTARALKAVLPHMRKQKSGLIINMSSVVGKISAPILGWYAASKHAIEGYTDALRPEVKEFGIKVVKIRPGAIKTEFDKVAFDTLDKIEYASDYEPLVSAVRKSLMSMYEKCQGPERTANIIVKAVKARNPHTSYATTNDAKMMIMMKNLLGEKLFGNMMLRMMK